MSTVAVLSIDTKYGTNLRVFHWEVDAWHAATRFAKLYWDEDRFGPWLVDGEERDESEIIDIFYGPDTDDYVSVDTFEVE